MSLVHWVEKLLPFLHCGKAELGSRKIIGVTESLCGSKVQLLLLLEEILSQLKFICKFLVKDTNYQVGNQDAHGRNWYLEDHPSY